MPENRLSEPAVTSARQGSAPGQTEYDDGIQRLRIYSGTDQQDLFPEEQLRREPSWRRDIH